MNNKSMYTKPKNLTKTTRHLYIAGIGQRVGTEARIVRSICEKFGPLDDIIESKGIEMTLDKGFCFVSYCHEKDAVQALNALNNEIEPITGKRLHLRYATVEKKAENPEPECTSLTANVVIPGLVIIPEFITKQEEEEIVSCLDGHGKDFGWETGLARRVAHFGHVFDYDTRGVNFERETKPIPEWGQSLAERIRDAVKFEHISDQLTVNEYHAGQGIAYHVDTHSAFEEELISLTLNAGCVMEFRKPCTKAETEMLLDEKQRQGELVGRAIRKQDSLESLEKKPKLSADSCCIDNDDSIPNALQENGADSSAKHSDPRLNEELSGNDDLQAKKRPVDHKVGKAYVAHKHVYLPRRCLVVMTGESRYLWEHHIASRKTDKVDGQVLKRGTRYSLTFRRVIRSNQPCQCVFPESCDAPFEIRQQRARKLYFHPSKLEKENVHSIYESIAPHWNHTRARRKVLWPRIKQFVEALPLGSIVADIGCGDGKYFGVNSEAFMIGCDRSQRLLDICVDKQNEVICCDALKVPYRSCAFDAVICVAVLHHLSTEAHRISALKELLRITRSGGLIDIQVWAFEQEEGSRKRFSQQDCLVPWKLQQKYATEEDRKTREIDDRGLIHFDRFCHVFCRGELQKLCSDHLKDAEVITSEGYTKSNWHIQLRKK